jgi:hypothetical protein
MVTSVVLLAANARIFVSSLLKAGLMLSDEVSISERELSFFFVGCISSFLNITAEGYSFVGG